MTEERRNSGVTQLIRVDFFNNVTQFSTKLRSVSDSGFAIRVELAHFIPAIEDSGQETDL